MSDQTREEAWVAQQQAKWSALDALLSRARWWRRGQPNFVQSHELSEGLMTAARDLSEASARGYSKPVVEALAARVEKGTLAFYDRASARRALSLSDVLIALPRAVRAEWKLVALAALLFFGPYALGYALTLRDPHFAFKLMDREHLNQLSAGYGKGFAEGRGDGEGLQMLGFYILNNVGIALQCFASGFFLGIGSALYLVYNGVATGAVSAYVAQSSPAAGDNFLAFVVGHSSFELGAIVVSGSAGMLVGRTLLLPGTYTRKEALALQAPKVAALITGASLMLVCAAFLEGLWSASSAENTTKMVVGSFFFFGLCLYFAFAGTARPETPRWRT